MPARGVAYYCGTQGEVLRFWKLGISSTPCGGSHKRGRGPPTLWWILMVLGLVYICLPLSATRIKPFCGFGVPCFFRFASLTYLLAILLLDMVHCISSLIFFARVRHFCFGRLVNILPKGDHVLVRLGVYLCWWRRPCNTITLQFGLRQNRGGWQEALPRDCFPSSFHTQGKKLRQKTTNKHNVPSHGIFVKHSHILTVILAEGSWIWILVRSFQ